MDSSPQSTRQRPAVDTTTPTNTPRRREREMKSPLDIKPFTPSLRRMSLSHTAQSRVGVALPESVWAYRDQVVVAVALTAIVCVATILSLIFDTAVDTSIHTGPNAPSDKSRPYFALKANLVNVWFVKYAWAWTSAVYLLHFLASLADRPTPRRAVRLAVPWGIATAIWAGFTTWFFGHGLFDRLLVLTGAECSLPLDFDPAVQLSPDAIASLAALSGADVIAGGPAPAYLPLPPAFCASRTPLTALTAPEIVGLLSGFPGYADSHPLRGRWRRGHDISGHTFLLVLAVMLLARQLGPTWRAWPSSGRGQAGSRRRRRASSSHTLAEVLGTALVGLWVWMLFMTGLYFHNPQEKLSGLLCGLLAAGIVEVLSPSPPWPPSLVSDVDATPHRAYDGPTRDNENRARRGSVVDDGKILEPVFDDGDDDPEQEDDGREGRGKIKQS